MKNNAAAATEFEPEFVIGLIKIFEELVVFNQVLGLKITSIKPSCVRGRIDMRQELGGHGSLGQIHSGAISAGLDAMGGLAAIAAVGARHMEEAPLQRLDHFGKLGTIDLQIDYLWPGISDYFELRAETLSLRSSIATTRMEFLAADGKLLSTATGAYVVS